jgi:hypothetical protein
MPQPKNIFRRSSAFRRAFDDLTPQQKRAATECFKLFKNDPNDPRLNIHPIKKLSSRYRTMIRSITIEGDLKAVYRQDGNVFTSLDIGKHNIYE